MELADRNLTTSTSNHSKEQQRLTFPHLADACLAGKYSLLRYIIKDSDHINAQCNSSFVLAVFFVCWPIKKVFYTSVARKMCLSKVMQRRQSYKGKLIVCVLKAKLILIPSLPAFPQNRLPLSTLCIERNPCPVLALRASLGVVWESATWHGMMPQWTICSSQILQMTLGQYSILCFGHDLFTTVDVALHSKQDLFFFTTVFNGIISLAT